MIEASTLSHKGLVRKNNEDRVFADATLGLFIVADGMGGQQHGEYAAELAISTIRKYIELSHDPSEVTWPFGYSFDMSIHENRLTTAIRLANRQVWRCAEKSHEYLGMGTTVAAVLVADGAAIIANIGDSRAYLFRLGGLTQMTVDDTWVANLVCSGVLLQEEARCHPMRDVLTQAAGAQETVEVHVRRETLKSQDILLLSSDGLHGLIQNDQLGALIANNSVLSSMAECLIKETLERKAPDNVSVVLVRYEE